MDINFIPPTIAQFQSQFPRDWPYGSGTDTVQNSDIQAAINEGQSLFNPGLFSNTPSTGYTISEAQIAFCYLAAHLMVLSLQNSGGLGAPLSYQGQGSSGGGVVETKTVDSVSVGYAVPDFVRKSPTLSQYMRTGYGQKYLQMVAPKIPGRRVMVVGGEPLLQTVAPNIGISGFLP